MNERDLELITGVAKAIYSRDLAGAESELELLRTVARSERVRDAVFEAKRKVRPVSLEAELKDPNPLAFPRPGAKPGDLGLSESKAA